MVKLNLLPPKERTKKKTIKENFWSLFLSFVSVALTVGFTLSLVFIQLEFDSQKKEVDENIQKQKDINSQYNEIETAVNTLNENIELITKLESQNPKWSGLLDEIRDRIPLFNASITQMTLALEDEKATSQILTIKGISTGLFPIAKFRESLADSEYFLYSDFESASAGETGNSYEFVLKLKIKAKNG